MIKAVLFDLWNTIAYNNMEENPIIQLERLLGQSFDKYLKGERVFETRKYKTIKEAAINLCGVFDIKPEDKIINGITKIWNVTEKRFSFFPDVIDTLKKLKGKYKIGLISNTDCFSIRTLYENGYDKYFDSIVFSFEVGVVKPNEKIFRELLQKLGVRPEECLMVGDNIKDDIVPAEKLGMKCVLMRRVGDYSLSWVEKGKYKNEINSLDGLWKYLK